MSMTNTAKIEYGGFWLRFLAFIIDSALLTLLLSPLMLLIYGPKYVESTAAPGITELILTLALSTIAILLCWKFTSATPGKTVLNLIIVDAKTLRPPTTKQLIIRYLGYYISTIHLGFGFIRIAFDKRKQGTHDRFAKTVVIKKQSISDACAAP